MRFVPVSSLARVNQKKKSSPRRMWPKIAMVFWTVASVTWQRDGTVIPYVVRKACQSIVSPSLLLAANHVFLRLIHILIFHFVHERFTAYLPTRTLSLCGGEVDCMNEERRDTFRAAGRTAIPHDA